MNICIVDDDKYVVEKIVEGIDWKKWDIGEVYVAYNIKHAKEILSLQQVDILLSDIEMPQGSGLELLEWVREQKLDVECIYLSSYAHFAYAQKALELHSKGYLLKPVSNKELENVLEDLVEQIRQKKDDGGESIQQEKEKYWRNLLQEDVRGVPACYGEEVFILVMLRFFREKEHNRMQNDTVFSLTLRHMAEEFMQKNGYLLDTMVRYSDACFVMVVGHGSEVREDIKSCMRELLFHIESQMHTPACLYIGKLSGIADNRRQMLSLLHMVREGVPGEDGLLSEEEWRGQDALYEPPDFSTWEKKMVQKQAVDEVSKQITDHVTDLWEQGRANVTVFKCFKADLQQMLFHYMMENNILMNQIFEAGEFEYYCDKASWTLRDMKEFICIWFKKLGAMITVKNTEENMVEQIMRYIDENLGGDLSRAKLAARAYISEDYLSKKFALHTGMSIPNYVSAKRMEKAQDYFKNTNRSVSEVAALVGYTNFSYFSKTFRDYAGCTPNEFKNRYK